ncbi:hypothetical protein RJ639_006280 [Escallonia herrerae]|uniref:Protein kinase domain-containing protein n=1 Tax=Escallonia herrerae TaxID=1293975 RepID=A0AA88VVC8_9ASTE|nr:hypothetical protein RJ639_006280 [Escallonia herrerae]
MEKATINFSDKRRLGTGAYGTVYSGKLPNDEWVAIKRMIHRSHTDNIEQVMNEIKLLSSVSHQNLVRLLGCSIENGEQILIFEFMPNGTLSQHLQRERGNGLAWPVRLTIATETAQAIAYLHSAINPPIYHRDIKSSNILLDYNYKSKVADFGLSRLGMVESSHISTAPQGTPGYLDPQYHQTFHLSDKSDVYSFGVVLVEIITALKAVDFSRPQNDVNLASLAVDRIGKGCLDKIIDPFLMPRQDDWTFSSLHKVAELAFRCLAFHSDMRPSMVEVAAELEQIRLSRYVSLGGDLKASSETSSCSSSSDKSEKPLNLMVKKFELDDRGIYDSVNSLDSEKDRSLVSVQDSWLSEESSPSSNSLLNHRRRLVEVTVGRRHFVAIRRLSVLGCRDGEERLRGWTVISCHGEERRCGWVAMTAKRGPMAWLSSRRREVLRLGCCDGEERSDDLTIITPKKGVAAWMTDSSRGWFTDGTGSSYL